MNEEPKEITQWTGLDPHNGFVSEIFRWPVKSMRGEVLPGAAFDKGGMMGDRVMAVAHVNQMTGEPTLLTARRDRWLLTWSASYQGAVAPESDHLPTVLTPFGALMAPDDPALLPLLENQSGKSPIVLQQGTSNHDVPGHVHLTVQATLDAFSKELGIALGVSRFRPNLHLRVDVEPFGEQAWIGRVLEFEGGLAVRVDMATERCVIAATDPRSLERQNRVLQSLNRRHARSFGVYGRVIRGGVVRVDEQFQLTQTNS